MAMSGKVEILEIWSINIAQKSTETIVFFLLLSLEVTWQFILQFGSEKLYISEVNSSSRGEIVEVSLLLTDLKSNIIYSLMLIFEANAFILIHFTSRQSSIIQMALYSWNIIEYT